MDSSIEATASSLEALSHQYQVIAHNLANANTAGYKRRINKFVQVLQEAGETTDSIAQILQSEISSELLIDHTQGALTQTDRSLDLALNGKGFFVVETPEGPLYTRTGAFRINDQGQLVDTSGRLVASQGGAIVLPANTSTQDLHVSLDGLISARRQEIGKLRLVQFAEGSIPLPVGGNCYLAPEGVAPTPAENTKVLQGFKEASNVNVVEELVGLITVTRLYEANIKVISSLDDRLTQILNVAMS